MHTHRHTRMHTHTVIHRCSHTSIDARMCTHTVCLYTCTHVGTHDNMLAPMHACTHTHIYKHTHSHTYSLTHTHTHTPHTYTVTNTCRHTHTHLPSGGKESTSPSGTWSRSRGSVRLLIRSASRSVLCTTCRATRLAASASLLE